MPDRVLLDDLDAYHVLQHAFERIAIMSSSQDKEKSKGISLRKKRTVKPKISAPKQISGPLPSGLATNAQLRVGPVGALPVAPRPRERPRDGNKTADLVKRRYSTRFTDLPTDFSAGAPPLPSVPSIPGQFAVQPPSRDGQPSGQRLKVDAKALSDPNLRPDQCTFICLLDCINAHANHLLRCLQSARRCHRRGNHELPSRS